MQSQPPRPHVSTQRHTRRHIHTHKKISTHRHIRMAYHMGPAMGVKLGEDRRVPHCTVGNPVRLHLEKQFEGVRALPRRRGSPTAFFDDLCRGRGGSDADTRRTEVPRCREHERPRKTPRGRDAEGPRGIDADSLGGHAAVIGGHWVDMRWTLVDMGWTCGGHWWTLGGHAVDIG